MKTPHYTTRRRHQSQHVLVECITTPLNEPAVQVTLMELGEVKRTWMRVFKHEERDIRDTMAKTVELLLDRCPTAMNGVLNAHS